ncbi:MAG: DUF6249 domain-containing protein [Gammaproteobacteria bacterium]
MDPELGNMVMESSLANIEWVPIVMFISLALIAVLYFYFRFRTRREMQHTVRAALDKGAELSPELLQQLGEPQRPKNADLRRGIIGVFLGIAFGAFGVLLGEEDAVRPMLAIGSFPLLIGVAYLGLWKFRE